MINDDIVAVIVKANLEAREVTNKQSSMTWMKVQEENRRAYLKSVTMSAVTQIAEQIRSGVYSHGQIDVRLEPPHPRLIRLITYSEVYDFIRTLLPAYISVATYSNNGDFKGIVVSYTYNLQPTAMLQLEKDIELHRVKADRQSLHAKLDRIIEMLSTDTGDI